MLIMFAIIGLKKIFSAFGDFLTAALDYTDSVGLAVIGYICQKRRPAPSLKKLTSF